MSDEKNRHLSARWLKQADADLLACQNSLENEIYKWACFQAQQAGEKYLKALWYFCDADPWGHSLVRLVGAFPKKGFKKRLGTVMQHAKLLDKEYIPTRYANVCPI